jgi:uncharacterized delta-60 repeat protein
MQSSMTAQRVLISTLAILLCGATQALAQAGSLDLTFANNGMFATTTDKSTGNAVAIQSDGKIVVVGTGLANQNFADTLIRLNTDGTLDSSFGTGGVANLQTGGFGFFGLAIQPDGKIVAAGAGLARTGDAVCRSLEWKPTAASISHSATRASLRQSKFQSASPVISRCSPTEKS